MLGNLNRTLGDNEGLEPDFMPLKEWPRDDRSKTLKGILCLHYLTDEHKQEWRDWFHSLVEVNHLRKFSSHWFTLMESQSKK